MGIGSLGIGFQPKWKLEDIPIMPKGRFEIMRNYMPKVGSLGHDMMFRTCTVQVNLDFDSEVDMIRNFRASLALQPIATALFANSPFKEGKPNGYQHPKVYLMVGPTATCAGSAGGAQPSHDNPRRIPSNCQSDNTGVIVNPKGEMKGSAMTGPIGKDLAKNS